MFKFLKNKRTQNIILAIFFISFFGVIIIWGQIDQRKLKEGPSNYTIATITRFSYGSKVAPWFNYTFKVKGNIYTGHYSINDKMRRQPGNVLRSYVGKQFFVKFYVAKPDINELLVYKPVLKQIKHSPSEGWKRIPKLKKERKK